MGVVYEAWDPDLGRTIALKVVAPAFAAWGPERDAYERRFLTEAKAAARLSHPGIVIVHDVGRDPASGSPYMALEYLAGDTLQERLAAGPLPWREALQVVGRVAEALHHAHSHGVVHRDIKPGNIMILPSGQAKILDFGIARVDTGLHTQPGEAFGTPLYMAPEQALGGAADARSDLFSLGSVAYTLLCGRPAFASGTVPAILALIAHRDPRPPSQVAPGLPADVDYLLARAMAKSPADRYPDSRMLAEDIEDVLAERPPRHRAGWTPPEPGAGTLVASPGDEADLPPLELVEAGSRTAAPAAPPRRRARGPLVLFALFVACAAYYFHLHRPDVEFWRREWPKLRSALRDYARTVTLPPASPVPPATVAGPAAAVTPSAAPSPLADASPAATPAQESAGPASLAASPSASPPAPLATASAAPPAAERPAAPRRAPATSQLTVKVEYEPQPGTIELWLDGACVARGTMEARTRRFKVTPGHHRVEVRVRASGATRSARTAADFKEGGARRLQVVVRRRGPPALEWK